MNKILLGAMLFAISGCANKQVIEATVTPMSNTTQNLVHEGDEGESKESVIQTAMYDAALLTTNAGHICFEIGTIDTVHASKDFIPSIGLGTADMDFLTSPYIDEFYKQTDSRNIFITRMSFKSYPTHGYGCHDAATIIEGGK